MSTVPYPILKRVLYFVAVFLHLPIIKTYVNGQSGEWYAGLNLLATLEKSGHPLRYEIINLIPI